MISVLTWRTVAVKLHSIYQLKTTQTQIIVISTHFLKDDNFFSLLQNCKTEFKIYLISFFLFESLQSDSFIYVLFFQIFLL